MHTSKIVDVYYDKTGEHKTYCANAILMLHLNILFCNLFLLCIIMLRTYFNKVLFYVDKLSY